MMARVARVLFAIGLGVEPRPGHGPVLGYLEAVRANPQDALAHFRLGELKLREHGFQSAANEFREALTDPHPAWIEAWAHYYLGEIFDITSQRERAVQEYRMAAQTGDDTDDVQALVAEHSLHPAAASDIREEGILVQILKLPQVVTRVAAVYSPEARVAELEGNVTLAATIAANGSVRDLRVINSLGLGLDEAAKAAAVQWSFEPGRTKDGPTPILTTIQLSFLFPSKQSRWHLLGIKFDTPTNVSRPHFIWTKYPNGNGVGSSTSEQAHLIAAIGREEFVRVSFDVDTVGRPAHLSIQSGDAVWASDAIAFVSTWRFSPGTSNGIPISVRCSVDLVWGEKQFTERSLQWADQAFDLDAIRSSLH